MGYLRYVNETLQTRIAERQENLKAVFFVKSFAGNPDYREKQEGERAGFGKKIKVK